jgi:hypothetical protein
MQVGGFELQKKPALYFKGFQRLLQMIFFQKLKGSTIHHSHLYEPCSSIIILANPIERSAYKKNDPYRH